ncbi:TNF receptor superfamily member 14 [Phyllostomus discolor]|uniref:TNF receptor superfamily member 14 n=1 Tax=Phyllostomus discolor TaxID=89673 RepID=A0A834ACK0_9CHIR|nr:TNF receptor superfamily member 14 [Phyllostomus discolor]
MDLVQAWELPRWSLEPTADALRLATVLVFLVCPHYALVMASCKLDEYPVWDYCCPKCRPGYRVKEACRSSKATLCVPCAAGTFTAHLNGLDECLQCRVCDPDMGLVTRKRCSSTANTECGCARGHFCVSQDTDQCAECRPHSVCGPGQQVRTAGTEHQDTVCEDCPPGTFSPNGTLAACQPWTQCSGLLERQVEPGTRSADARCSSWALWLVLLLPLVLCVAPTAVWLTRRHLHGGPTQKCCLCQGNRQQAEENAAAAVQTLGVTEVLPDVTTVAVEETASMFPKTDPTADQ